MTTEELAKEKITMEIDKTFELGGDLDMDTLEKIIEHYYGSHSDLDDILNMEDYNVTIHD